MTVHQTVFILRVLRGTNAGAAVRLKTGSLVIGRSMSSDIILYDEDIADKHVQLTVTPSVVTIKPLVQPVFVGGQEVGVDEISLPLALPVRVGNAEFVVVDSRAANDRRSGSASATAAVGKVAPVHADGQASISGESQPTVAPPLVRKPATRKLAPWLGIGLGLLILGNLVFFAPRLQPFMQGVGLSSSSEQQAEALMHKLGQEDFALQQLPDGSLTLKGYVDTVAQRSELMREVQKAGIKANMSIWAQDELLDSAEMISRTLGEPAIRLRGVQHGHLLADGFVSSDQAWERIKTSIMEDVTGVKDIADDNIQTLERYQATFAQFIGKNGLSNRVKLSTENNAVIVKGELTQKEIEQLTTLREEFIKSYDGTVPDILLKVRDVRDSIKLAIRSVSVGKVPFIVSKEGKKYQEGANLGENYFIKSIKPDFILLTSNGVEIPLYYGIEENKSHVADRTKLEK